MKPVAIIPARGGSKRLPRKNVAMVGGKPLICHVIETVKASEVFSQIVVSSEDDEILQIAGDAGAYGYRRSQAYATDEVHELAACAEYLGHVRDSGGAVPEIFSVVYPTAALIMPQDLRGSFEKFSADPDAEALMCVSVFNYHPYKSLQEDERGYARMVFPQFCRERSQTYPHLVASNGTFYWLRTRAFLENSEKGYYQDRLMVYEVPASRAIDVDYQEDLLLLEREMNYRKDL